MWRIVHKKVISVLDPVFLLERESWQQVEKVPDRKGYVLVYTAEWNKELQEYALALAKEKNLPAVILRASKWGEDVGFEADYISGPSEFLGYIHNADYVVTNSFHAIAFSIIYQKSFWHFFTVTEVQESEISSIFMNWKADYIIKKKILR